MKNKKLFESENYKSPSVESTYKNIKDSDSWFHCNDYQTYKNRADYIATFYDNPLINPATFSKFEELKDTKLFCLTGANDMMQDDSIELAKKWKGDVCLDVFNNMPHGFLHLKYLNAETKLILDLVTRRIQEACGLI